MSQTHRQPCSYEQFSKIIDVPRNTPESTAQHPLLSIFRLDDLGFDAQKSLPRIHLEVPLLVVRAPAQNPSTEERCRGQNQKPCWRLRIRFLSDGQDSNGVKVWIETQTAPGDFEAKIFSDKVICVEVRMLEEAVVHYPEAE